MVSTDVDLSTLHGPNGKHRTLVESLFRSQHGNITWGAAKLMTKDAFLDEFCSGNPPGYKVLLIEWMAHYELDDGFKPQEPQQPPPPPSSTPTKTNTEELWQSILRIRSDVDGDVATALVFDVFVDEKKEQFLYLLTNQHYTLEDGNTYIIEYCGDDNVFIEVDSFEKNTFEVWRSSTDKDYVIYKLPLSKDIWSAGLGIAQRKPASPSKRARRITQEPLAKKAPVICKTPVFWHEGVHPGEDMVVYALPAAIQGRWLCRTSVTNVGPNVFYLAALSAPGGSGGAVLATKSGKMVGYIGGAYDVQEPESTSPRRMVDRLFNTFAYSVNEMPVRLSSEEKKKLVGPRARASRSKRQCPEATTQ